MTAISSMLSYPFPFVFGTMELVECQFLGGRKYRSMLSYVRILHGSEARDTQKIVKIHHAQLRQNDGIRGGRSGELVN